MVGTKKPLKPLLPKEVRTELPFGVLVPSLHDANTWFLFRQLSDEVVITRERNYDNKPFLICEPNLSGSHKKILNQILL